MSIAANTKRKLAISETFWVFCLMLIFTGILFWGIQRNLPYAAEVDEPIFIRPALDIASSGNLNPGWFGNPGSTIIYPLALLFHLWYSLTEGFSVWQANAGLSAHFSQNFATYYYLGRLITVLYAAFTLPFIYLIGKRVFAPAVALIGTGLFLFYPYFLLHAQMIRTDSASLFFVALTLWLILRMHENGRLQSHLWVGLAIGFGVSTKYVLAALIPAYVLACFWRIWPARTGLQWRREAAYCGLGLMMVAAGLFLSSPYLFLDYETAVADFLVEARSEHAGADGLSKGQNLWYYLTDALPAIMTWPQALLAYAGIVAAFGRRHKLKLVLLAYVFAYLVGSSLSALHWQRWALQILPVLVLFVADFLYMLAHFLAQQWGKVTQQINLVLVGLTLLVIGQPVYDTILHSIRQSTPTTRVLARDWMVQNIPADSKIGQEAYTALLVGTNFSVETNWALAEARPLTDYYDQDFEYLVVSSGIYGRFYAEPDRFAQQVQFYDSLSQNAELLQEFYPSQTRGGPIIKIYHLTK